MASKHELQEQMRLKELWDSFVVEKRVARVKPGTIKGYIDTHAKMVAFFPHDPIVTEISLKDLVGFFHWLACGYETATNKAVQRLSSSQIFTHRTRVFSFFEWLFVRGYIKQNLVRRIKMRRPESKADTAPLTIIEVSGLLKAAETSVPNGETRFAWENGEDAKRDLALLLLLLDSGIRGQELMQLRIKNLDLEKRAISVATRVGKTRTAPFGKRSAAAIVNYLHCREILSNEEFLFSHYGKPLSQGVLRKILGHIGLRADVSNVTASRIRKTAISLFLITSKMSVLTVKTVLGFENIDSLLARQPRTIDFYQPLPNVDWDGALGSIEL